MKWNKEKERAEWELKDTVWMILPVLMYGSVFWGIIYFIWHQLEN